MGAYKYYNPSTQQWEIVKSKSIIKPDGSLEYTPDDIKNIEDDLVAHKADNVHIPKGLISMWSGLISNIPNGWALCNGENGTPDLKDRFIMGATVQTDINKTGGKNEVTLTVDQIPSHKHTVNISAAGTHTHNYFWPTGGEGTLGGFDRADTTNCNFVSGSNIQPAGIHTHSVSLSDTGGGQVHENRPAYYKLAFIMKV